MSVIKVISEHLIAENASDNAILILKNLELIKTRPICLQPNNEYIKNEKQHFYKREYIYKKHLHLYNYQYLASYLLFLTGKENGVGQFIRYALWRLHPFFFEKIIS